MISVDRLVREGERKELTGVPTSSWYRLIGQGLAPPGIKLSKYATAWLLSELEAVNAARVAGKTEAEIKTLVKRLIAARARAFDQFETAGVALAKADA